MSVSKGPNKKPFELELFQFCDLKTQQRYILQEEVNISKRELSSSVRSLRDYLTAFDQANKCIQIPLPKPKVEIGSRNLKDNLFTQNSQDVFEHSDRQTRLSFRFGSDNLCVLRCVALSPPIVGKKRALVSL